MIVRALAVANRATGSTVAGAAFGGRRPSLSSSSFGDGPRRRRDDADADGENGMRPPPWWSLPSLRGRVAAMIASALPDGHLSEKLLSSKSSSQSIDEAIVSARAREAAHRRAMASSSSSSSSSDDCDDGDIASPLPRHSIEGARRLEEEIERRAIEKARERMELELRAMEEKYKSREEERVRMEAEERERREAEHRREIAFERWKEEATREMRRQEMDEGDEKEEEEEEEEEEEGRGRGQRRRRHGPGEDDPEPNSSADRERHDDHTHDHHRRHHPILGPQIARLPYKRVHLTPASTLASIPVYERQRAYRHDRAMVMAKDKRKTLWMGIPGVISLMEDDDGRLSILDGQHRVGMMALLAEERRKVRERGGVGVGVGVGGDELDSLDLENVLVEVFVSRRSRDDADRRAVPAAAAGFGGGGVGDEDDMAAIFTEINKAEPVKLLDLPGVTTKRTRDIIDHAASHYRDAYPAMFSTSARCRAPHLNLDNLRDALFASEVIQRERMGSGGELVRWMSRRNDELRERYGDDNGGGGGGGRWRRRRTAAMAAPRLRRTTR